MQKNNGDAVYNISKHAVELGQTYRNDKACKDLIIAISDQFKNEIVMVDSATYVGVREVEHVYVRYLKDGEPVNAFVGLTCRLALTPKPRVSLKLLTLL